MIKNTSGNNAFEVSPAGLEHQQSQSPVADATGNDVAPSGLIANFKTAFGGLASWCGLTDCLKFYDQCWLDILSTCAGLGFNYNLPHSHDW